MRHLFVVAPAVVLLSACSPYVTAQRTPQATPNATTSPSPTPVAQVSDRLLNVRMTSANVIWAETSSRILRSADRGATWDDVTPIPHGEAGSFFALDNDAAWFVTILSPGSGSDIYRTLDGGHTWARSGAPLPISGSRSLNFVDRIHGWATVLLGAAAGSEAVAVLRSVDGGASWSRVADTGDPTQASPSPSGIAFFCDKGTANFGTRSVGLLPVECAGGAPYVYRSRDGGLHWTAVSLPNLGEIANFVKVEFLTSTDVILVGDYYNNSRPIPTLLVSHDGGLSWQSFPLPGSGTVDFESVYEGWQLDSPMQLTDDGGMTWHPLTVPAPPFTASEMTLQDLGKGIAIAWSSTAVYLTELGATTWTDITPPQKAA